MEPFKIRLAVVIPLEPRATSFIFLFAETCTRPRKRDFSKSCCSMKLRRWSTRQLSPELSSWNENLTTFLPFRPGFLLWNWNPADLKEEPNRLVSGELDRHETRSETVNTARRPTRLSESKCANDRWVSPEFYGFKRSRPRNQPKGKGQADVTRVSRVVTLLIHIVRSLSVCRAARIK